MLAARIRYLGPGEAEWRYTPLTFDFNTDRWLGSFALERIGKWEFTVEAWTDVFETWRTGLEKKIAANQDVDLELREGALLAEATARKVKFGDARRTITQAAKLLQDSTASADERRRMALSPELTSLMREHFVPRDLTTYESECSVTVDRDRAQFAAWYEMFPRSQGEGPGAHGTFVTASKELERIAKMGFDVVYLPPIHPIGRKFRKGKNNSLTPLESDVGSPWAIGNEDGGHTAVNPALGTLADFEQFVRDTEALGMEVALDYALQCSPDHPWVKEHPDWFHIRPDGSIQYAENPPKKYQDIYPIDFWCEDREALWAACRDILLFWMERGVRTFRVDNPHTKPFAFWEWMIADIRRDHPDVIFFAEAFTRPKRMKRLGKLGFTMSYTYFTWKNTASELREYLIELTQTDVAEYLRGNLFANTPDILHEYLQHGGRPAFLVRLLLASTLLPLYGIYSGYELSEHVPVRAGSEEYLDSEKYEIRYRDWDVVGNLQGEIALLNRVRRENRALQLYRNLTFHRTENDNVLFYVKRVPGNDLLIIVNLDPKRPQETMVHVPLDVLRIGPDEPFIVEDQLTGARYAWRGARNYVRLDPQIQPGHLFKIVELPRRGEKRS
jgi:starch synthase (maltosyl-transferring)